jgi:hypothetical protein
MKKKIVIFPMAVSGVDTEGLAAKFASTDLKPIMKVRSQTLIPRVEYSKNYI